MQKAWYVVVTMLENDREVSLRLNGYITERIARQEANMLNKALLDSTDCHFYVMECPTHPEHVGTTAHCRACFDSTYGVALDCAYDNMQDDGQDLDDHEMARSWALSYVENGDVSAYYCHRHDPINLEEG